MSKNTNAVIIGLFLSIYCLISCSEKVTSIESADNFEVTNYEPIRLNKSNPINTFVHYKSSYTTIDYDNYWAFDWILTRWRRDAHSMNPGIIRANGKRDIASDFYPLIDVYSSNDPDVIDYHLLLMKYSGFDGLILEWSGYSEVPQIFMNSLQHPHTAARSKTAEAVAERAEKVGLSFMYNYMVESVIANETMTSTSATYLMIDDISELGKNHLNKPNYFSIDNRPVLHLETPMSENQFSRTAHLLNPRALFIHNWQFVNRDSSQYVDGFYTDINTTNKSIDLLSNLSLWYNQQRSYFDYTFGSAHIGQNFYYDFQNVQLSHNKETLRASLQLAKSYNLDYLQVFSWNNYFSGEIIEPTQEFGYEHLEIVQNYAETSFDKTALEQVHRYYLLTKAAKALNEQNAPISKRIEQVFYYLISLQLNAAIELMDEIDVLFTEL